MFVDGVRKYFFEIPKLLIDLFIEMRNSFNSFFYIFWLLWNSKVAFVKIVILYLGDFIDSTSNHKRKYFFMLIE